MSAATSAPATVLTATSVRVCACARSLGGVAEALTGYRATHLSIFPWHATVHLDSYVFAPDTDDTFELVLDADGVAWRWATELGTTIAAGRADTTEGAHELVDMFSHYLG